MKELTYLDFESAFGESLSSAVREKIKNYSFQYEDITETEFEESILRIVSTLLDPNLLRSGEHRLEQWEKGWTENLHQLAKSDDPASIIPHYFGKYGLVRFKQKFLRPVSEYFEYHMLGVILDWLFDKYMKDAKNIYEFGCGTGHNLFKLKKVNPNADLWGLDWATSSQDIIRTFASRGVDKMFAHRFDYFNPDFNFKLEKNSIVYTVASLEQIGDKFEQFVSYLLEYRPSLCIHIEPIGELLDKNRLIDYLSVEYFKKRNYLNGYLNYLKKLENDGSLKIQRAQRTYVGSFFIEGYSVIVWNPI